MCLFFALWVILIAQSVTHARFVPEPKGFTHAQGYAGIPIRYKEVPSGICESTPGVKSITGYADISEKEHMFFWFFETRTGDPSNAPLTIWFSGGPGASSMADAFAGVGPCSIHKNATITNNPFSWSNVSNLLFVDQPLGVGWSYTEAVPAYKNYFGDTIVLPDNNCPDYAQVYESCGTYSFPDVSLTANSSEVAAVNVWKTLQGFMGAFPQYSQNGIHIAGESYAGLYIPAFSAYILQQNEKNVPGARKIPLKSITINNGFSDESVQFPSYFSFLAEPGNTYDLKPYNETFEARVRNALYTRGNCLSQLQDCNDLKRRDVCLTAESFCANYVEGPFYEVSDRYPYDIRNFSSDAPTGIGLTTYLNSPTVQQSAGAFVNWTLDSNIVYSTFITSSDGQPEGKALTAFRTLLAQGITVTLWAGDADYICNWLGVEAVAKKINSQGFDKAGYARLQTPDNVYHGDVRQSGIFSFTRMFEAGHMVPFNQPLASLELFRRSISGLDIATGKVVVTKDYKTVGQGASTFREGKNSLQSDDSTSTDDSGKHVRNRSLRGRKRRLDPSVRKLGTKDRFLHFSHQGRNL